VSPTNQKERSWTKRVVYPRMEVRVGKTWQPLGISKTATEDFKGRQVTVSEGHRRSHDGKYRSGGPFYSASVKPSIPRMDVTMIGPSLTEPKKYRGPLTMPIAPGPYAGGMSFPSQSDKHLDAVGASAVHAVDPTDPNAQTGLALAELVRDGTPIPGIQGWRRRTEIAKAAGSEYLNAVFGWLPLVSDIKDTSQSIRDGNVIIDNYRAASGTLVHREFAFPTDVVEEYTELGNTRMNYSPITNIPEFNSTAVMMTRHRITETRKWFSGSFTYYASPANSLQKCLNVNTQIDKLFGLSLTPDIVWELTPWSWAIDWFSNAGDVIANIGAMKIQGLVMKYGYIMEEKTITDTYSMPDTGLIVHRPPPPTTVVTTVKRRKEANPFGFGVSWDGLSPSQLAISAALGITRLR